MKLLRLKGKVPRKHSMVTVKASVLLKLFISGDERCHTTNTPLAYERNSIFKCKQHSIYDLTDSDKYTFTSRLYGATYYSRYTFVQITFL